MKEFFLKEDKDGFQQTMDATTDDSLQSHEFFEGMTNSYLECSKYSEYEGFKNIPEKASVTRIMIQKLIHQDFYPIKICANCKWTSDGTKRFNEHKFCGADKEKK